MPIYEYECGACGDSHEFIQKFSEGAKRKCPSCGKLRLKKKLSAAAFHLKGGGWYVTDFRDGGKKKSSDSDSSSESSASDSKSSGDGSASESKSSSDSAVKSDSSTNDSTKDSKSSSTSA